MQFAHVVVVGAGFGGMEVARRLAKSTHSVLLIDRNNYHCFQPLLYQVATAGLEPEQIAYPVRAIIRDWPNVRFLMAEVQGIDRGAKTLMTSVGAVQYEHLVVAAGGRTNDFGLPGVAEHGFGLKSLDDAVILRNHLLRMCEMAAIEPDRERRRELLTFVVVGGGPTGVEMAGALRELARHALVRDYPGLVDRDIGVILLEATDTLLATLPKRLQKKTIERLRHMGVDVRLNTALVQAEADGILLKSGERIATRTLIWAAGIKGVELAEGLESALARGGRVVVEPDLRLKDDSAVWVIGDLAYVEQNGQPLPQIAPVAVQQGAQVARNIEALAAGKKTQRLRYRDKGSMATIGRNAAVAHIGGISFAGFSAWVVWLVVHLMSLVGFRNRVVVLVNWAYNYFFYERAIRLITGEERRKAV